MAADPKSIALLLGLKRKPEDGEESDEGEEGGSGRLQAAKDVIAAIKDDDAEALLEAFDRLDADDMEE